MSLILVVDENDQPLGEVSAEEVRVRNLIRRSAIVVVEDENGRILLQKRALHKKNFPGVWDYSAAGQVETGETYEEAAYREFNEELDVTDSPLTEIAYLRRNEQQLNSFSRLYKARITSATVLSVQQDEIDEVRWFTPAEAKELFRVSPNLIAPGVEQIIAEYFEL